MTLASGHPVQLFSLHFRAVKLFHVQVAQFGATAHEVDIGETGIILVGATAWSPHFQSDDFQHLQIGCQEPQRAQHGGGALVKTRDVQMRQMGQNQLLLFDQICAREYVAKTEALQ